MYGDEVVRSIECFLCCEDECIQKKKRLPRVKGMGMERTVWMNLDALFDVDGWEGDYARSGVC